MAPSQPPQSSDTTDHPDVAEIERSWAPRPRRLLVGVVLIAVGIGGSILNSTGESSQPNKPAVVVHGPVETQVKALGGLRVRAELLSGMRTSRLVQVAVSFHNNTSHPQIVAPADLHLRVGTVLASPLDTRRDSSQKMTARPGSYITIVFRFAAHIVPGTTLVYQPAWSRGRSLVWLLWQ
jgi:hypothetical protein